MSDAEIDRLFALPLEEFTAARNALAARLKAEGNAAGAGRVKALAKPGLSAWAVNQLYWRMRPDFDAVVKAGDRLRAAQQQLLAGRKVADFAAVSEARDAAVARALKSIDGLAAKAGVELSPAVRQRAQTTLGAVATQGSGSDAARGGRMTEDLEASGFQAMAALAAMTPAPARPASSSVGAARPAKAPAEAAPSKTQEREAALARLQVNLARAESELKACRDAATRAGAALGEAEDRATRAREDVDLAKRQLADAMARATRAIETVNAARRDATKASAAVQNAEAEFRKLKAGSQK